MKDTLWKRCSIHLFFARRFAIRRVLVLSLGQQVIRCISTLHSFSSSAFKYSLMFVSFISTCFHFQCPCYWHGFVPSIQGAAIGPGRSKLLRIESAGAEGGRRNSVKTFVWYKVVETWKMDMFCVTLASFLVRQVWVVISDVFIYDIRI